MKQRYWFKAKTWGYGWSYPLTWQGWLVYTAFFTPLALFTWWAIANAPPDMSDQDFNRISFLALAVLLFVMMPALVWICVKKGEPTHWRWGRK